MKYSILLSISAGLSLASISLADRSTGSNNHIRLRSIPAPRGLYPRNAHPGPVRTRHGQTNKSPSPPPPPTLRRTDNPPPRRQQGTSRQQAMSVRLHTVEGGINKKSTAVRAEKERVMNMPTSPFDVSLPSGEPKRGNSGGSARSAGKKGEGGLERMDTGGSGDSLVSASSGSSTARSPKEAGRLRGSATMLAGDMAKLSTKTSKG